MHRGVVCAQLYFIAMHVFLRLAADAKKLCLHRCVCPLLTPSYFVFSASFSWPSASDAGGSSGSARSHRLGSPAVAAAAAWRNHLQHSASRVATAARRSHVRRWRCAGTVCAVSAAASARHIAAAAASGGGPRNAAHSTSRARSGAGEARRAGKSWCMGVRRLCARPCRHPRGACGKGAPVGLGFWVERMPTGSC